MKHTVIALSVLATSFNVLAASSTQLEFAETIPLTCGFVMENADLEGSIRFSDERISNVNAETPATFRVINNGNNGFATITMRDFSVWDESNNFGANGEKTDVEAYSTFAVDNGLAGISEVKPEGSFQVASSVETEVRLKVDMPSYRFDADSELRITTVMDIDCL
ncbi:hypothetical protein L4D06_12325 [Enterovibrio makurazakiensis]|uniref:Uncharacterized protein n=1 Tax=Enterovibrio gelatinilyticus TaxID=2899819 RepID=A0ABT5R6I2_9GAMM|nr:hypothetical protein [Enterovibrio sp. ZSDZ42]MDD1795887.1 hypothetical protein [Enterovibrio sp. ZSDZ42]